MDQQQLRSMISAARAGDETAYQQLLAAYGPRLYGYFFRATGSHHDAEDLLGELMLRLVRNLADYDDRGRFEPWMFRIASNLLRDRIRRARANPQAMSLEAASSQGMTLGETLPQQADGPDHGLAHLDLSARLAAALEKLEETSRQMVLLRHFAQMSFKEIAEAFECPLGTVLAKVHRALKSLRQVLENDDDSLRT